MLVTCIEMFLLISEDIGLSSHVLFHSVKYWKCRLTYLRTANEHFLEHWILEGLLTKYGGWCKDEVKIQLAIWYSGRNGACLFLHILLCWWMRAIWVTFGVHWSFGDGNWGLMLVQVEFRSSSLLTCQKIWSKGHRVQQLVMGWQIQRVRCQPWKICI